MKDKFTKKIKLLNSIAPSARFTEDLRGILFSQTQSTAVSARFSIRESLASGLTIALGSAFVVLMIAGGSYLQKYSVPVLLPGLHEESISSEFENLDIQIKLAEARYYSESPESVSLILNESGNNTPNHLNNSLIQKESRILDIEDPTNEKIDDVLNQLL